MEEWLIVLLSFLSGFLFSPWAGGFFMTLIFLIIFELVYGLFWPWGKWRILVVVASLIGWIVGRLVFLPILEQHGTKRWIDDKIKVSKDLIISPIGYIID